MYDSSSAITNIFFIEKDLAIFLASSTMIKDEYLSGVQCNFSL